MEEVGDGVLVVSAGGKTEEEEEEEAAAKVGTSISFKSETDVDGDTVRVAMPSFSSRSELNVTVFDRSLFATTFCRDSGVGDVSANSCVQGGSDTRSPATESVGWSLRMSCTSSRWPVLMCERRAEMANGS